MAELSQIANLEAALFAAGDPVSVEQLADIFERDAGFVEDLIDALDKHLAERGSGLSLRRVAGGVQLVTRRECFPLVAKLAETRDKKLTAPAMETLSIIAYRQPITKQEIEDIRGVRVERTLAKLVELELIREKGRKRVIGRPILYGTTENFLKCFGLNALEDLPQLPELSPPEIEEETGRLAADSDADEESGGENDEAGASEFVGDENEAENGDVANEFFGENDENIDENDGDENESDDENEKIGEEIEIGDENFVDKNEAENEFADENIDDASSEKIADANEFDEDNEKIGEDANENDGENFDDDANDEEE